MHTEFMAQFESTLMTKLCKLWGADSSTTTLHNPLANGVMEQNNLIMGDSLPALLLRGGQNEWEDLFPRVMRAIVVHRTPQLEQRSTF